MSDEPPVPWAEAAEALLQEAAKSLGLMARGLPEHTDFVDAGDLDARIRAFLAEPRPSPAPSEPEVIDHVLYYVERDPAEGPAIMSGRLVRKTCPSWRIRPATQADVDAWDPSWATLEFDPHHTFDDGSRPAVRRTCPGCRAAGSP